MFARLCIGTLGCIVLVQTGCGRSDAEKSSPSKAASAGAQTVTLYVEGMRKRLNLF